MPDLSVDGVTNLLSYPAAALALVYVVVDLYLHRHRLRSGTHLALATAVFVAALGFLLRPLSDLGLLLDGDRTVVALVLRTAFLIVMLGATWAAIDVALTVFRRRRSR